MANEQRYTLEQIAGKVGFRADDLPAIMPDANIDMNTAGHEDGKLSEDEAARLIHTAGKIKQLNDGSPESGAD